MTIEQLLNCSADQLEKMTDAELLKYFEPFLSVTRPDIAKKSEVSLFKKPATTTLDTKLNLAKDIASKFGINLDDL